MPSQQPIFRTVEVGHQQPITLGEPLTPDVRALMDPPSSDATELHMRQGTFSGAQSITVDLAPDMDVEEVEFTYDPNNPGYDSLLQSYTDMLGPPDETDTLNDAQRSATWSDEATEFTLWERGANAGSVLLDLLPA